VKFHIMCAAIVVASLAPSMAQAQGIPDGVTHGGTVGYQAAGPVGAVVGGAVGGVVGGVEGLLGVKPTYASYPDAAPPQVYHRHHHWARHSYRRAHTAPAS
jgi:hypothetical protein